MPFDAYGTTTVCAGEGTLVPHELVAATVNVYVPADTGLLTPRVWSGKLKLSDPLTLSR